jgi:outer membrane protein TolC
LGTNAQVQVNPELKQLINQSFGYFPKLKEAANLVVAAEDRIELNRLGANPFVGASAGYSYLAPVSKATLPINGGNQEVKFFPNHNYNATVNANYILVDFGRLKANIEKAKNELNLVNNFNSLDAIFNTINILKKKHEKIN